MVKRGTARARPPPDAAPPDPKKPRVNTAVPTTVTLLVELATWKPPAPDGTPSTVHAPVFLTSPAGAETSDAAVVIIPGAGGNGNALGMESFASSLSSALSAHVVRISLTGNQQWPVRRACTVLALIERLSHGASRLPRVDSFVLVGISNGARVASVVTDALPPTAGLRGTVLVSYPIKGGNGAARTEHVRLVTKSDMHPKLAFIHSAGDPGIKKTSQYARVRLWMPALRLLIPSPAVFIYASMPSGISRPYARSIQPSLSRAIKHCREDRHGRTVTANLRDPSGIPTPR